jgi:hypothetical protein
VADVPLEPERIANHSVLGKTDTVVRISVGWFPIRRTARCPTGTGFNSRALHDRRIVAFTLKTTTGQDDRFIRELNDRKNAERFNLLFRNCADFARDIVKFYYPKALRSSFMADLGADGTQANREIPRQLQPTPIGVARL